MIVTDDLGYTDLGAFGSEIPTPNLDRLARSGIRFTNFHTAPSCAPTRAMLMTGMDNHQAGMGSQSGLETAMQAQHPAYRNRLSPEVPTIAEHMRDLGYRTIASAKWHLGAEPEYRPGKRGFDRSLVLMEGGGGHFDDTPLLERYGKAHWFEDDKPIQLPADFYSTRFMTDKVLEYIEETQSDQPFFAYLGYTSPHWPLQAPRTSIERQAGRYDEGWDRLREQRMQGAKREGVVALDSRAVDFEAGMVEWDSLNDREKALAARKMEVYAAMVADIDEEIGRLLARLNTWGRLENTVVVFLSDNGAEAHTMELYPVNVDWVANNFDNSLDSIGTKESYVTIGPSWARATAAPFRASKSKISEGGIRVPAFVNFPAKSDVSNQGSINATYMRVMDLAPTFIELAGGVAPIEMEGRSLLSGWRRGTSSYAADEFIAMETYGRRAVQRGQWKALLQYPPYGSGEWQLYDLSTDPGEQRDLSEQHPELRSTLIEAWQAYADRVGVVLPEKPIGY